MPSRVFIARLAGMPVFDPLGDQVGRIRDVEGGTVAFEVDGERREVRIDAIQNARLAEWPDTPR